MKKRKPSRQSATLTPEAQRRLVAYTTAVGLGAFFGGQAAEGQVTASQALAPYPKTITTTTAFSVPGDAINDFYFSFVAAPGDKFGEVVSYYNYNCLIFGENTNCFPVDPLSADRTGFTYGYPIPWTVGAAIGSGTSWEPNYLQYGGQMANGYHNTFSTAGDLGFAFARIVGSVTNTYYGYMNIQITGSHYSSPGFTLVVNGIYYNATPGASINAGAVPSGPPSATINVTGIKVDSSNNVTINFTSSDNAAASAFSLQKSSSLGVSASWTTDTSAVISSTGTDTYQATTTTSGGVLFYRINE